MGEKDKLLVTSNLSLFHSVFQRLALQTRNNQGLFGKGLRHFKSSGHIMAVGDTHVFPGFLTRVLTQHSFQSHRLLFLHVSAEVREENTLDRKFASTWDQTYNQQVMGQNTHH